MRRELYTLYDRVSTSYGPVIDVSGYDVARRMVVALRGRMTYPASDLLLCRIGIMDDGVVTPCNDTWEVCDIIVEEVMQDESK